MVFTFRKKISEWRLFTIVSIFCWWKYFTKKSLHYNWWLFVTIYEHDRVRTMLKQKYLRSETIRQSTRTRLASIRIRYQDIDPSVVESALSGETCCWSGVAASPSTGHPCTTLLRPHDTALLTISFTVSAAKLITECRRLRSKVSSNLSPRNCNLQFRCSNMLVVIHCDTW